jgi:hypothetical protein
MVYHNTTPLKHYNHCANVLLSIIITFQALALLWHPGSYGSPVCDATQNKILYVTMALHYSSETL